MQRTAFMTVAEVAETLGISKSHAYKIVHRLNQELKEKGYVTIAGRISRDYLLQRTVGKATEEEAQRDECL